MSVKEFAKDTTRKSWKDLTNGISHPTVHQLGEVAWRRTTSLLLRNAKNHYLGLIFAVPCQLHLQTSHRFRGQLHMSGGDISLQRASLLLDSPGRHLTSRWIELTPLSFIQRLLPQTAPRRRENFNLWPFSFLSSFQRLQMGAAALAEIYVPHESLLCHDLYPKGGLRLDTKLFTPCIEDNAVCHKEECETHNENNFSDSQKIALEAGLCIILLGIFD